MDLPQELRLHGVRIKGEPVTSVSRLFAAVPEKSADRNQSEFVEAVRFAKCLQVWYGHDLKIYGVNENATDYKGIDFFLSSEANHESKEAFQLVEFKMKYSLASNTEEFAQWIIDKKFKKGDKRVHLVVAFAPASFGNLLRSALFGAVGELPFEPWVDVTPGTKRDFANCGSSHRAFSPTAPSDSRDETSVSAKPFHDMRSLYRFDGTLGTNSVSV